MRTLCLCKKKRREKIKKKFDISGVDPLILFGFNDHNLLIIEENFKSKITVRGDNIFFEGEKNEISLLENLFSELIFLVNKNKKLEKKDVLTTINLIKSENKVIGHARDDLNSVILFTDAGFIKPRTAGQEKYAKSVEKHDIVFCIGPAGTGKTYVAVAIAVSYLKTHRVKKIILARPAVEAGESLGFLPGDFKEKVDPYLRPLYDALYDMMPVTRVRKLMTELTIEIVPLAYMRGRTLNNAFVILDEAQNTTPMQMKMSLTRLGVNSKAIITGDITQIDLKDKTESGLVQVQSILKGVDGIDFIYLDESDVVRHKLVKSIINAYEKFNDNNNEK